MKHFKDFLLTGLTEPRGMLIHLVPTPTIDAFQSVPSTPCNSSKWSFVYPVQEQPLSPFLQTRSTGCRWKVGRRNEQPRPTVCKTLDWEMVNTSSEV